MSALIIAPPAAVNEAYEILEHVRIYVNLAMRETYQDSTKVL